MNGAHVSVLPGADLTSLLFADTEAEPSKGHLHQILWYGTIEGVLGNPLREQVTVTNIRSKKWKSRLISNQSPFWVSVPSETTRSTVALVV
jgi:hypothetical protein